MSWTDLGIAAAERGLVPDPVLRSVIRRLCRRRLRDCERDYPRRDGVPSFLPALRTGPIALVPERANEQHYEIPPAYFEAVLGPRRKYSCCLFPTPSATLAEAEDAALEETARNADLSDGQQVLELGCGWGSLSLWMAERYPQSLITAVSNSAPQRQFIEAQARQRGFTNLTVVTADMNTFDPANASTVPTEFDRVVSVEMFEHMRNYDRLLERIARWLAPDGRLFVHVFCHRDHLYPFEEADPSDWMARHFFSGGLMPSRDLFRWFDNRFTVEAQADWNGTHYERTSNAWLANLDARRQEVEQILTKTYGPADAARWLHRWRMFFLAVAELFGLAGGNEWCVTQCRLRPVR